MSGVVELSRMLGPKVVSEATGRVLIPVILRIQHPGYRVEEFETVRTGKTLWHLEWHTERV